MLKINSKEIKLVETKKLKFYSRNRNKHNDEQIQRLDKIIQYQGFRVPLIVDKKTNEVIAGNGRLEWAHKNGIKHVPVIYQTFENEDQRYAFSVSDNAIASWANLDLSTINQDIVDMGTEFDVDLLGIKDFMVEPAEKVPQCDEDEIPEKVQAKTVLGDIYQLGDHRLMCGDSTSVDAVEKLMNGEKADMVFTDPPYGMNLDTNYDKMFQNDSSHVKKGNRFEKIKGDDVEYDPNPIFLIQAKEYFIWGADYFYDKLPKGGSWIAWDKRDENLDRVMGNTTEFLWSKKPHRRMSLRVKWSGHHGMQREDTKTRIHPTQKPVQMIEKFFEEFGSTHKTIVDIYLGSGSTLIACEKTNRKCYGMEIDPHYCDVIVARWEKYTGKKAILNGKNR